MITDQWSKFDLFKKKIRKLAAGVEVGFFFFTRDVSLFRGGGRATNFLNKAPKKFWPSPWTLAKKLWPSSAIVKNNCDPPHFYSIIFFETLLPLSDSCLSDRCTICFILLLKQQRHNFTYFCQSWKVVKRLLLLNQYDLIPELETTNLFQFGTLYHFRHQYMHDRWKRIERGRREYSRGGPGACSPVKFWNLASLKRTFGAISERIKELKWTKTYGENKHARDSRHQMLKEWLPQAF